MAIYSIRDLEKLTGIKAHTIRIWEQRYRLVAPARTETNIRYYTDENLRHLFNVALLNRHGFKISKLAKMTPEEIATRGAELAQNNPSPNAQIEALTLAMIDLDEADFDRTLAAYVREHGFQVAMLELVYPFLDKLKLLWLTNSISPAHEKFVSNLIRRKLMCAIDGLPLPDERHEADTFVLYSPEGESQDLALLFVHYLLRSYGQRVVYLGSDTALRDLRDLCHSLHPQFVLTILQEPLSRQSVQSYVDYAAASTNGSQLLLTGAQLFVAPVQLPANAAILNGLPDMLQFLDNLKVRAARRI
jgi:MerR family transcriptional regulator, light-induced transcriptional regulator